MNLRVSWLDTWVTNSLLRGSVPSTPLEYHSISVQYSFITVFANWLSPALHTCSFSGEGLIRDHGLAALSNACAHPVLAGRAKELEADKLLRKSLERSVDLFNSPSQMAQTAFARLYAVGHGIGDLEEGSNTEYARLRFYRFKWGARPSHTAFSFGQQKSSIVIAVFLWMVLGFMGCYFGGVI